VRLCGVGSTFVVGVSDGAKPLLAGSVPDLEFDVFVVRVDGLEPKIHANGGHVVLVKLVVGKPQQQAALAHGGVPHDDVFEEMIVLAAALAHIVYNYMTNP